LEGGGTIALAPEGTRVKPGETRPPKPGVGFLAAKAGAWVQPARLVGAAEFPRKFPLEVRFGSPLPPPAGEGREAASSYARTVMDAIYAL
jgi:1-acyl-sn-glycerol-3-phosphate acyltransferase